MSIQPSLPVPAGVSLSLAGTHWSLAVLRGEQILPETYVNAQFGADGVLSGTGGCNRYRASFQVDGSRLTIDMAAATMMACPPPILAQEQAYLAALQAAVSFDIGEGTLALMDEAGETIARYDAEPQDLAGTAWTATGYNNGKEAVVSLLAGTRITATFDAEGKLAGNAGCNNYGGTYSIDGESISIGRLRTTRKLCAEPQGLMEQERLYLAALETAATHRIDGRTLELRAATGALAAKYRRAGGSTAAGEGN